MGASSKLEALGPQVWIKTLFGPWAQAGFAAHHIQFWEHIWSIRLGHSAVPFIAIWPRGGAKSTSVEMATAALGAKNARRYALYVSATQEQADDHVQNVGALLESKTIEEYYPQLARRSVNKYGSSRGWRRNRLWTASGYTVDAAGLDTAIRGIKLEDRRPDLLILDDLDSEFDNPAQTEKKIQTLTRNILPAGSRDYVVIGIQNLVLGDGIFARLANIEGSTRADFLQNRIVSGPFKSVNNPTIVVPKPDDPDPYLRSRANQYTLVGGSPIWEGQDLKKAQKDIDDWGYSSWLVEAQQEVDIPPGGLFADINFDELHVLPDNVPEFERTTVWVDPAVTDTDRSDSHGINVDGLGVDGKVYTLWSFERRVSPAYALRTAILKAIEYGSNTVGVETDQGGDLWKIVYENTWEQLLKEGAVPALGTHAQFPRWAPAIKDSTGSLIAPGGVQVRDIIGYKPAFTSEKAGAGYGPKMHRATLMLTDYQRGLIRHVINEEGTQRTLERALRRFGVRKPYDLADAKFWCWNEIKGSSPAGIGASDDSPQNEFSTRTTSALARALHVGQPGGPDAAYTQDTDRMRLGRMWQGHSGEGRRTLWRDGREGRQP